MQVNVDKHCDTKKGDKEADFIVKRVKEWIVWNLEYEIEYEIEYKIEYKIEQNIKQFCDER